MLAAFMAATDFSFPEQVVLSRSPTGVDNFLEVQDLAVLLFVDSSAKSEINHLTYSID